MSRETRGGHAVPSEGRPPRHDSSEPVALGAGSQSPAGVPRKTPSTSQHLAITDRAEIEAFRAQLPIALGPGFVDFVLGFPREYLGATPPAQVVKHFALMRSLGAKAVVSSLSREDRLWRLCVVARDRRFLFCRIAGALSRFGMNILGAEAFANATALVLDTFRFSDPERVFEEDAKRRAFQAFLEDAVEGKVDLAPLLRKRLEAAFASGLGPVVVELEGDPSLSFSRLTLNCRDRFGLLYLVSRCISEEGCNIELARVETPGDRVCDEFFVTRNGAPLADAEAADLREKIAHVAERYRRRDVTLLDGRRA